MEPAVIEREEWLILLGMISDIRHELEELNDEASGGDDDEEAQEEP